jgi:uncharacterized membrane protein
MDFIQQYFIQPIISPETMGYNPINTGVYILILSVACFFIYKYLSKKITFDENFFKSLLPFVIFGAAMRALMHQVETGMLNVNWLQKTANPMEAGFWFFTPGIWVLTFALVCVGMLFSGMPKKFDGKKLFKFGILIMLPPVFVNLIKFDNWVYFFFAGGVAAILTLIIIKIFQFFSTHKFFKQKINYKLTADPLNKFVIAGQALDSTASIVAILMFNFTEQHLVSKAVIDFNPLAFILVKVIIAVLLCWSLDDYVQKEKKHQKAVGFLKIVLAIIGFATGGAGLIKIGLAGGLI